MNRRKKKIKTSFLHSIISRTHKNVNDKNERTHKWSWKAGISSTSFKKNKNKRNSKREWHKEISYRWRIYLSIQFTKIPWTNKEYQNDSFGHQTEFIGIRFVVVAIRLFRLRFRNMMLNVIWRQLRIRDECDEHKTKIK